MEYRCHPSYSLSDLCEEWTSASSNNSPDQETQIAFIIRLQHLMNTNLRMPPVIFGLPTKSLIIIKAPMIMRLDLKKYFLPFILLVYCKIINFLNLKKNNRQLKIASLNNARQQLRHNIIHLHKKMIKFQISLTAKEDSL